MPATIVRLTLLACVAALPAWAQPAPPPTASHDPAGTPGEAMIPPAANAATGIAPRTAPAEPRADSIRPDRPAQGLAAGQGTDVPPRADVPPALPPPGNATGAATGAPRVEGGQDAVRIDEGARTGVLEPGANSFTEGQARSRIEAAGFNTVRDLRKDGNGIWRGHAMLGGEAVEVGLDYRGNVARQ